VPLVSLAARQALVDRAHAQPGQKVLVHAGSGGLGSTVIQGPTEGGFDKPVQSPSATPRQEAQAPVGLSAYRIEILPLWAPWAPAVSCLGGGVPGINGAFAPYTGRRAIRRVTPCPTPPPAGIAAASGAAADPP
jgi:hypothetical protein